MGAGKSLGSCATNLVKASNPPADVPITTMVDTVIALAHTTNRAARVWSCLRDQRTGLVMHETSAWRFERQGTSGQGCWESRE